MLKFEIDKLYISKRMGLKDVQLAFHIRKVDNLIGEGLLVRKGRFFSPTEKLLNEVFLPKKIVLTAKQRRFLSLNAYIEKRSLVNIFGGGLLGEQTFNWFFENSYLVSIPKGYRGTEDFLNWIFDGGTVINTSEGLLRGAQLENTNIEV